MNTIPNYVWPIIFLILQCYSWFKKPSESMKVNVWPILAFLPLYVFVMNKCGFFEAWHWQQIVWVVITSISIILVSICQFFDLEISKKNQQFNFSSFIVFSLMMCVFYSGGMFKYLL